MSIAAGIALYLFVGVLVLRLTPKSLRSSYFYDDSLLLGAGTVVWPVLVIMGLLVGLGKLAGSK